MVLRDLVRDLTRCSKWREAKMERGDAIPLDIRRETERFHITVGGEDVGLEMADMQVRQAVLMSVMMKQRGLD